MKNWELDVNPCNTLQEGRKNSTLTFGASTCVLCAACQQGLIAQDHANLATCLLVWKLCHPSGLEYIQGTLISTWKYVCSCTLQLRYGILGQKGDTAFSGLSAAAVLLTAVARNLKVTVSFLSDSVYPVGFWLLRKVRFPSALLFFGFTTFIDPLKGPFILGAVVAIA